jgi:hypothetical protein
MYDDIRKIIWKSENNRLDMSRRRHVVYTYNARTVEQKYLNGREEACREK